MFIGVSSFPRAGERANACVNRANVLYKVARWMDAVGDCWLFFAAVVDVCGRNFVIFKVGNFFFFFFFFCKHVNYKKSLKFCKEIRKLILRT